MQSVTTYDGYGRAATQKLPQQTIPTSYAYYSDDLVQSVTDPRGVVATNTYNNRHLLTGVSYSAPAAIDAPAPVSFGYDGAGNRTSMADGTGSISYHYDELSRMTSETRTFTELNHQYTIGYAYNLSGGLTSITDPSGAQVSYNYDQTGRLTSMPAIGYDGVTQFLSNAQYRAFGGMKHATYGNSLQVDLNYNARMQIGQYQASGFQSYNGTPYTMGATMSYYADGRTNTAFDLNDGKFDRKYEFDFSARLKEAYSGIEAHGQPAPPLNQANSPYRQSYTYDEWNNALSRSGRVWTVNDGDGANYTSNNKRQGWGYDTAGNALTTNDGAYTYDAAGRPVTFVSSQTWQAYGGWDSNHPNSPALETADIFDGSGQIARHVNHTRIDDSHDSEYGFVYWLNDSTTTSYYVHSTVLGGKTIAELNQNGAKTTGYVYAGGARIATQHVYVSTNAVEITCTNPVTGSAITTDANAAYALRQEPDALGRDLATPPDHGLVSEPLSNPLFKDRVMPIEYTGGPSDYYEQGNADWAAERAEYTAQYQAGYFDAGGYFDLKHQFIGALINLALSGNNQYFDEANQILANNPNFALQINGKMTAGQDAANALTTAFANLPGDPVALNRPKFAHASHNAAPPRSGNSTMIITWDVDEPWSPVGHVSYITMQDDTSYSWDMDSGHYYNQEWTIATPSSKYTDKRSDSSEGHGYILDFGGELNSKFQNALLHAYDGGWFGHKRSYDPVSDNCGQAFNIAINAISKDIGLKPIHIVSPWEIRKYIENNLRNYIAATTPYPKH